LPGAIRKREKPATTLGIQGRKEDCGAKKSRRSQNVEEEEEVIFLANKTSIGRMTFGKKKERERFT